MLKVSDSNPCPALETSGKMFIFILSEETYSRRYRVHESWTLCPSLLEKSFFRNNLYEIEDLTSRGKSLNYDAPRYENILLQ